MFLLWPIAAFSGHSLILRQRKERDREIFATLTATFLDVFAPWMWQVLLGYMWTPDLPSIPASGDTFGGNRCTYTHSVLSRLLRRCRELYECSLSCQGTACRLLLTAGRKWWSVCVHCCQWLKITCCTCDQTLKRYLDQFSILEGPF